MEFRSTVIRGHSGPIYALEIDSDFVYSTSSDGFVTRWNLETAGQDKFTVKLDNPAYAMHLHNGVLFLGSTNGTVRAINLQTKSLIWEINRFGKPIFSICWSETLDLLLAGDAEGSLFAIDIIGKSTWYFPLDSGKIRVIREFDDHFYVGSQDGKLRCFQLPSLNEIWSTSAHDGSVYNVLKLHSGLVTSGFDGKVSIINDQGNIRKSFPVHYQSVYGLEKFENGFVTCSKDKTIKIWDSNWNILKKIEEIGGHTKSINAIVCSENRFITAGDDKTIRIWNKI